MALFSTVCGRQSVGDHFWTNWGNILDGMSSEPVATQPNGPAHPDIVARIDGSGPSIDPPPLTLHAIDPVPQIEFGRWRFAKTRTKISTVRFANPEPANPEPARERARKSAVTKRAHLPRSTPPAGLPLRERIHSMLQPPVSAMLGDQRLWLPFEPFPYQYEGVHFLFNRWSALLADEMGLGKTMQAIMAIRLLLRAGLLRSALLVCPKPLVTNWLREFELWADEIPVATVHGDSWTRRHLWIHDTRPVKIANYESLRGDASTLDEAQVSFDLVVLDEAQRIKNRESKTAQVIHSLRRKRSWALTGTPVENRATDLVSLLEFVQNRPCHIEDRPDLLRDEVGTVLLRRTKDMVLKDLPAKLVRDAYIDLGPNQQSTYDAAEKEGVLRLGGLGDQITIEHVFELIRALKQICNFDPATGESAKAEHLRSDLEEIAASNQKAILFSQWVSTIESLAERLADFRPLVYHGKVPQGKRDGILDEFKRDQRRSVLLMSYGTGAVGLNLQFSNYVYLFDRWWNPAVEDQAINRAHRVGQKSRVFVARFITPGTIEERIAEVLQRKRELFSFLIDDHEPEPADGGGLSREDVFGLFDLRVRS